MLKNIKVRINSTGSIYVLVDNKLIPYTVSQSFPSYTKVIDFSIKVSEPQELSEIKWRELV